MKRLIVSVTWIVFIAFLCFGEAAAAESSNYAALKIGAYFPNSSDLNGFNTGLNGEVALGHYFNSNFAMELGLGFFQSQGNNSATGAPFSATSNGDIYAVPITLALKAIYPINQWEIYAMGGAGAYYCNGKVNANSSTVSTFTGQSDSTTTFGGFLGAGADYNIDKSWFIGIEGKYLWAKPQLSFFGQNFDVKLDGWIATGNVGFRF